jgi:hypothetical protein
LQGEELFSPPTVGELFTLDALLQQLHEHRLPPKSTAFESSKIIGDNVTQAVTCTNTSGLMLLAFTQLHNV